MTLSSYLNMYDYYNMLFNTSLMLILLQYFHFILVLDHKICPLNVVKTVFHETEPFLK